MTRSRRRDYRLAAPLLYLFLALTGCGEDVPSELVGASIERDVFVATYVDLRVAALDDPEGELSDSARGEVLARHSVTEEDLLQFVEAHGEDLAFMQAVWEDVEQRLDEVNPAGEGG